jgi:hypothetical protein
LGVTTTRRIYLDIDETLVATRRLHLDCRGTSLVPRRPFVDADGEKWVSYCRPGAGEFVAACQALAPTCYFTSGGSEFQSAVLQLHGLPRLPLLTLRLANTILPADRALLVDDLAMPTMGIQSKLQALLPELDTYSRAYSAEDVAPKFTLFQVSPWGDPSKPDDALTDLRLRVREWTIDK